MNPESATHTPSAAVMSLFSGSDPGVTARPFPAVGQLRGLGPVVRLTLGLTGTPRPVWVVTRLAEVIGVLRNAELFTVDPRTVFGEAFARRNIGADDAAASTFMGSQSSMLSVDDPDHRRLRSLVSKVFTPTYMEGLRPRVQALADDLLDRVQAQGHMDIVRDYAAPLPINVISEMLGVPAEDRPQVHRWSTVMARGLGQGAPSPETMEAMRAFGTYTAELVARKRVQPADDLISQLIALEEQGDRLNEQELFSMITLLIFAGHETTSNLLATGTYLLLTHPEQLARLKADPSLMPGAVEELIRYDGPAWITGPRFATADTELAGQQIRRGDMVLPMVVSANHDEGVFSDPDTLDIARKIQRHVGFGQGIHMCLGAPLARIEGDVAFSTLLRRMPELRLAVPEGQVAWHASLAARALETLPVVF